jgi:enoyl-CoA hydratase
VNLEMIEDFLTAVAGLANDAAVGAVVITGAGGGFCAGADIAMMRDVSPANYERVRRWVDVQAALEAVAKPVIAAIKGYALGGGAELALACDFRWMAADAAIGFPEIGQGIFPEPGGTQRLARLLGPARALDVMVSGRRLTPAEALELGLVQRVVAPDALAPSARAFARELAREGRRARSGC